MRSTNEDALLTVLEAALHAVDPGQAVKSSVSLIGGTLHIGDDSFRLAEIDGIYVVGAGKAGAPMAHALVEILGDRIIDGLVTVKYGHATTDHEWHLRFERRGSESNPPLPFETVTPRPALGGVVRLAEAGHPVPDEAGARAAGAIHDLANALTRRDLLLVVLSGGASALMPLPADGITLSDLQALTDLLLGCGAAIGEINVIRKHCSKLSGGQLVRCAAPARVATLVLSDVVGNPLSSIGSGPTVPDTTTFRDALAVMRRYRILESAPANVRQHLELGATGAIPDTPKSNDPLFERVSSVIVGDNTRAARAAERRARELGWQSALLTTFLQGEAREVGKVVAGLAQGIARDASTFTAPTCLLLGGETTVTIKGGGVGGRNQELALAAAIALDQYDLPADLDVTIITLATDGTDGPTDAAGGRATPVSIRRARALGLDSQSALANNDSYHLLGMLGDLLVTGPTHTNVNDLTLVAVLPRQRS